MTSLGEKKFRELEKVEEELKTCERRGEEDLLLAIAFGLKMENIRVIYEEFIEENPQRKGYEIFFKKDFYKNFKVALVGDHLLVRN